MTLDDEITRVIDREGAVFTNDPQDEPTKYGITLRTYRDFKTGATLADLQGLDEPAARAFYRWRFAPFRDLNVSERCWDNVIDAVTLHGPTGAVRAIQQVVGARVDGIFGAMTIGLITKLPETKFLVGFAKARIGIMVDDIKRDLAAHYGTAAIDNTDMKYARGWFDRVIDVAFGGGDA